MGYRGRRFWRTGKAGAEGLEDVGAEGL